MLLPLSIGLDVFDRFYRRHPPSIGQRLSVNAMEGETSDNCHEQMLREVK
jgi:hypothetical protein